MRMRLPLAPAMLRALRHAGYRLAIVSNKPSRLILPLLLRLGIGGMFDALVGDYIDAHPSVFRNVRWFGGQLADFLRDQPRYAGQPILADLARFDAALSALPRERETPAVRDLRQGATARGRVRN